SLQRRHQKIIEEAPSPLLDPDTRALMGEAAVQAARSCGYVGAGTVEFIVPGADPAAYCFMEMNTRLQVEHPVTELITGLDLVEWQLRIAAGERLPLAQDDISLTGHAVEARICAETARVSGGRVDFLPSAGTVLALSEPDGEGVRVDSGLAVGTEVGTVYDPMLAKVVAHGPDRPTALRRLRAALARTTTLGLDTNTGFLRRLAAHPAVASGDLDTGLVDREAPGLVPAAVPDEVYAAAALLRQAALEPGGPSTMDGSRWVDPFSVPTGWRLGGQPAWTVHALRVPGHAPVTVRVRGRAHDAEVWVEETDAGGAPPGVAAAPRRGQEPAEAHSGTAAADGGGEPRIVRARLTVPPAAGPAGGTAGRPEGGGSRAVLGWGGMTHTFAYAAQGAAHWLGRDGDAWHVVDHDPVEAALRGGAAGAHAGELTAPMPGTVTVVKAAVGDEVTAGQGLVVVEAMKMEHVISAPHDGTVTELDVTPGSTVAMDQLLAVVAPREPVVAPRETEVAPHETQ
ncbi:biotin/lipoyl-containing protein, partial [Streptomyces sp. MCAF7]